jgi:HlyD family secretion protein
LELKELGAWLRRNRLRAGLVLGIGLAGVGFAARDLLFGTPVPVYAAVRSDLTQSVVASGQVITPRRVAIAAESTGRVVRVPVEEGQRVSRGQVLIEQDQSDELAALAQARAAVAQADAKLRQLNALTLPAAEQNAKQAQANVTQAQQQYRRTQDLVARKFVSQAQLDDAQRNLDVASSQLRAAQLQVETNRPTGSDYALARTALDQAKATLLVAQAKFDQTILRAPADGILIGRSVEPGDVAEAGKELMLLAPDGATQLVVQIDEKNLARLALGQKALASADAYPDQRFPAEVVYINPGIDPQRGAVEVKLQVTQPPAYLRQDMTISVDIEVGRHVNTLVVPTDAIHDSTSDQPWVLVVRDGRAQRQPISVGLRGDGRTEVLSGISAGDALIPATSVMVAAGQRVRGVAMASGAKH